MSNIPEQNLAIPESYQPLALICFGLWGWIVVLYVSHWQRIDVNTLLHTASNHRKRPILIMATTLTAFLICHIALLEHTIFKQHTNIFTHFGLVILCYVFTIASALYFQAGQRFFKCLCRLFKNSPVNFSDVLVADILISFSGVFTTMCINLMQVSNTPYLNCAPFVTSIPYLIRLKQCLYEYYALHHPQKSKLVNAFKYALNIPVIFLAHHTKSGTNTVFICGTNKDLTWHVWFLLAILASAFAFGWDLIMDWGLLQIEFEADYAFIRLRKDLYFSDPLYYIAASGLNGSLRLLKIGSNLYHVHPICVEFAEISRRWIWVMFRFENEWIKRSYSTMDMELQQQPQQ